MTGVILRRLGATVIVIWGAVSLIFLLIRLAPGDPAIAILGPMATPDQLEALREKLGLDSSLLDQYLIFLGDLLRFDFGDSVRLGRPAIEEVMARLPSTLTLAFIAAGMALLIGIPLGVLAGRRQGGVADRVISTFALIGKSIPGFWFGLILILVFARQLHVLPSFGSGTPAHLVLPAITLTLPLLVVIVRLMRASVVDTLREPFVTTAYSKGLLERTVLADHVARNSLLPVVTVSGLQLSALLGGAVITETVFSWPGIGALLVESVAARDYSVVQAISVVVAIGVVLINVLTDLLYLRLDPRIRLGAAA